MNSKIIYTELLLQIGAITTECNVKLFQEHIIRDINFKSKGNKVQKSFLMEVRILIK